VHCTSAVLWWLRGRKRVEDDRTRAAGEEAARVKGVQERRKEGLVLVRISAMIGEGAPNFGNGKGQRTAG